MARATFVCFLADGRVALIPTLDGGFELAAGDVMEGEDVALDTALRIPLETAGFRRQRVHEVARHGDHLLAWVEGDRYRGRRPHRDVELVVLPPDDAAAALRDAHRADLAEMVEAAAASYAVQTDESYFEDNVRLLEAGYLRAASPQGQSGFGGSSQEWRAQREQVADAVGADGTFLDIGCANGFLMECVVAWCAGRGLRVEPYGIDLAPALVALARRRLPQWADRLWVGNALDWTHPDGVRFDVAHVLLDTVPERRRAEMLDHHLSDVVRPGGRLVVSHYVVAGGGEPPVLEMLAALDYTAVGSRSPATAWLAAG